MPDRKTYAKPNPSPKSPHPLHLTPDRTALVVFAKAPIPGQVNTRLCPPLTPDEAATLHGSFVLDSLERTKAAAAKFTLPIDRYLACAPSSAHVFFKIMEERQGVRLIDQVGEDVGARMHQTFDMLFTKGYRQVIIVGTDVPSLPLDQYKQACTLLASHDLVLGPALDGGYYLIGLAQPRPDLFAGIPWSTEHVLARTQERAKTLGLTMAFTGPWRDVDTAEDLRALIEANALDAKKPRNEQVFSGRTTGALQLIAKRLLTRTP